jgi:hypothetical protein
MPRPSDVISGIEEQQENDRDERQNNNDDESSHLGEQAESLCYTPTTSGAAGR